MTPTPKKLPWEINPEFQRERLIIVAQIFLAIRERCVKAMLPVKGDDPMVLGLRAFKWTLAQSEDEARERGASQWLHVKEKHPMQFDLRIGGVSLHYFRGDSENPPERAVERGLERMGQGTLFPHLEAVEVDQDEVWIPCLVVNADTHGNGIGAEFFQVSDTSDAITGDRRTRNVWQIPVNEKVEAGTVRKLVRSGNELPRPIVTPKRKPKDKSGSDGERGS